MTKVTEKGRSRELPRNLERLVEVVHAGTVVPQSHLVEALNCGASTVSTHLGFLREAMILDSEDIVVGRERLVRLNPDFALVAGVSVFHRGIRGTITNAAYEPLQDAWFDTDIDVSDPHETVDAIASWIARLLGFLGRTDLPLLPVGLGLPTPINVHEQRVPTSYGLDRWQGERPGELLEDALRARYGVRAQVRIHNDATLGALGCYHVDVLRRRRWPVGEDEEPSGDPLVYARISDGIGMGLMINGRLYDGTDGFAGEFGHMTVLARNECPRCGRRGCLETVASTTVILDDVRRRGSLGPKSTIYDAVDSTDRHARAALRGAGAHVGRALSHVTNLLNPARLVVGGVPSRSEVFMSALGTALEAESLSVTHVEPIPAMEAMRLPEGIGFTPHEKPELAGAAILASQALLGDALRDGIEDWVSTH